MIYSSSFVIVIVISIVIIYQHTPPPHSHYLSLLILFIFCYHHKTSREFRLTKNDVVCSSTLEKRGEFNHRVHQHRNPRQPPPPPSSQQQPRILKLTFQLSFSLQCLSPYLRCSSVVKDHRRRS